MSNINPFPVGYQPAQIIYPPYTTPVVQNSPVQVQQPINQQPQSDTQQIPCPPVIQPVGSNMLMVDGRQVVERWVLNKGETMVFFDRNKDVFYIKAVSDQGMPFPIEECTFKRKSDESDEPERYDIEKSKYVTSEELDNKIKHLSEIVQALSDKLESKEVNDNGRQLIVR